MRDFNKSLKTYIKSGNITQKKNQDFERFLKFLKIKMTAKSNKIELSEEGVYRYVER